MAGKPAKADAAYPYQLPTFGMLTQGSAGASGVPFCNNSMLI